MENKPDYDRYMLFASYSCCADGGMYDCIFSSNSIDLTMDKVGNIDHDHVIVFDRIEGNTLFHMVNGDVLFDYEEEEK